MWFELCGTLSSTVSCEGEEAASTGGLPESTVGVLSECFSLVLPGCCVNAPLGR